MRAGRVWLISILFLLGLAPAALAVRAGRPGKPGISNEPGPVVGCGPGSPGSQGVEAGTLPGGVFRRGPGDVEVVEPVAARTLPD